MKSVQAIIYNVTRDRWYVFLFTVRENSNVLIPSSQSNPYTWMGVGQYEINYYFQQINNDSSYAPVDIGGNLNNIISFPKEWAGQQFLGLCFHQER